MGFQLKHLPPEVESGNVEYKLKLVGLPPSRIVHLITQMNWRLREGDGEAFYEIGVEDDGTISGVVEHELKASLTTLKEMADTLNAETIVLKTEVIDYPDKPTQYAAKVFVKKRPENHKFLDIRVACLGSVDVGKSTLLSVLSYGDLDDGKGRARLKMFRHLHEIQSGRTSSISQEILGFDSNGQVLNCSNSTVEKICTDASKVITFYDLAGHQKYIKTTLLGLIGYSPDVIMVVIAANKGLTGATKENLGLAIALKTPLVLVINKTDTCSKEKAEKNITQLKHILRSSNSTRVPVVINDLEYIKDAAHNFSSKQITPIFKVSSVTGSNLQLLCQFFNELPSLRTQVEVDALKKQPVEFQIDKYYNVPSVGVVLSGTLRQGTIRESDELVLGPTEEGHFHPLTISTLHRNKTICRQIDAGQSACLATTMSIHDLALLRPRGQVLLTPSPDISSQMTCIEFEAEVLLLFHATKITPKFQCTVHIRHVVQTAYIKSMDKKSITSGQRAKVIFRFIRYPECIRTGDRMLFRDGKSKGIGKVTIVSPFNET